MRRTNSTLVRPEKPPFQKSRDPVSEWQEIIANIGGMANNPAFVTQFVKIIVSAPAISPNYASRSDRFLYCIAQAVCRCVWYAQKADSSYMASVVLSSNVHQGFALGSPATFSVLFATDVCFIDFDSSGEPVASRTDHGHSQLVEPRPCCSVTAKAQSPLEPKCADTMFLVHHMPNRAKPQGQRLASALKHSSSSDRQLVVALLASPESSCCMPSFVRTAARASESVREPHFP